MGRLARLVAAATTTGLAVGGLMVVSTSPSSAALQETDYGLAGTAYGTRILSRGSGLESGRSAYSWIGCTRLLGRSTENHLANISLPSDSSVIHVSGVQSDNETYRRKSQGIDSAIKSTNSIGEVALGGGDFPLLTLEGLTSTSTAWATTGGQLKAENEVSLADVSLTGIADPDDGGPLADLFDALDGGIDTLTQALVDNGGSIVIPNLGRVSVGYDRKVSKPKFAAASSFVLRVTLYGENGTEGGGDDTIVGIGRSWARVNQGLTAAVMTGQGYGATADLLDGTLDVGRLGAQLLPCPGTDGKVLSNSSTGLNLLGLDQFDSSGIRGRTWGVQRNSGVGEAWVEGSVSDMSFGPLEIHGIVGRVNLKQNKAGKMVRQDIKGSSIGEIVVDGDSQGAFDPATADQIPPMEIPGLGSIEFFVKEKTRRGMTVSAVVLHLADDTAGVTTIRLGNAQAHLKRY